MSKRRGAPCPFCGKVACREHAGLRHLLPEIELNNLLADIERELDALAREADLLVERLEELERLTREEVVAWERT